MSLKALDDLKKYCELYEYNDRLQTIIKNLVKELRHYVELPKNADGDYISHGDLIIEENVFGEEYRVTGMEYALDDGKPRWMVWGNEGTYYEKASATHTVSPAHEVENILREFVTEYNRDDTELCDEEIIERFASKLQLKERQ